jgi:hypothetical protein
MAEQLSLQINIGGKEQVLTSFGEIKKAIKDAEFQALALSEQFGASDKRVLELRSQIGKLKDTIEDSSAATKNYAGASAIFPALAKSVQGIASGFTAVQGAIGLLGVESKEVEKTLLKVQSAMAFSQGLGSLIESKDAFINLAGVIKGGVINAFNALKTAISGTGILALAVGVGLLIQNFDAIKKVVLNFIPVLGKVADFVGKLVNKVTDFIGVTSEAGRATAKLIKENEKAIKDGERFLDLNGDKYDEYTQRKIKANLEYKKKFNEFQNDETLSEEQKNKFIKEARDKADREILKSTQDRNDKQIEINKKSYEEQKKLLEERKAKEKKEEEDRIAAEKERAARNREATAPFVDLKELLRKSREVKETIFTEGVKVDQDALSNTINIAQKRMQSLDTFVDGNKKATKTQMDLDKAKAEAQIGLASDTLNILGGLIDQNSVAGKAIAISQAIINTYQGASKAIAQGGIFGPVAAAATIAAGIINVKKIISTKVPSAKGGGDVGGGGGVPSISSAAPMTAAGVEPATTNISQQSINALGNQAMRAYVVETDVTSSQQRIAAIQQRARFN